MDTKKPQLIVALDVNTLGEAEKLVKTLDSVVDIFKVGSQLFTTSGPTAVKKIMTLRKKVFLDLKYHDIPNTVSFSTSGAVVLNIKRGAENFIEENPGLFMLTVHIVGGKEMLEAAVKASRQKSEELKVQRPFIIGVTVLTSEEKGDNIQNLVLERALLAKEAGLDGVVVSVNEAKMIRQKFGEDFIIVTPGIRPKGADPGDQKRIATPTEAVLQGSNFLVVGRPITESDNPLESAKRILEEINAIQ